MTVSKTLLELPIIVSRTWMWCAWTIFFCFNRSDYFSLSLSFRLVFSLISSLFSCTTVILSYRKFTVEIAKLKWKSFSYDGSYVWWSDTQRRIFKRSSQNKILCDMVKRMSRWYIFKNDMAKRMSRWNILLSNAETQYNFWYI